MYRGGFSAPTLRVLYRPRAVRPPTPPFAEATPPFAEALRGIGAAAARPGAIARIGRRAVAAGAIARIGRRAVVAATARPGASSRFG
jgi:hypothetical protein